MDIAQLVTILTQLTLAVSAWNLAKKVAAKQVTHGERLDNHEVRIIVLEKKAA